MKITDRLKVEHGVFLQQLRYLERLVVERAPAEIVRGALEAIVEAEARHSSIEDRVLYPALASQLGPDAPPLQMAADLIENYEDRPAFQFIRDVAVDWERTEVLDAAIGDYVVVARQERDGDEWFLGAITDEEARTLEVSLDFLEPGRTYTAEIYADGSEADWLTNPLAIEISRQSVDAATRVTLRLAPGGGTAVRLVPR